MIRVENVSFGYKNAKKQVLENLSFTVEEGEIVAIVGQNGSGKSTIGKLIAGILPLKHGSIQVDELELSKKKDAKSIFEKVGIVFQNPENQIIFNKIEDELAFPLKGISQEEMQTRIQQALKEAGMSGYEEAELYTLSLGQKQRIMLAEVLARKPKYILLDEPTTMIDSEGKEAIYEIVRNLKQKGYTILWITNLADEMLLADRVLILDQGKIACEIAKKDLEKSLPVLQKYQIKAPLLLHLLAQLREAGLPLAVEDFTVEEIVKAWKEKNK